VAEDNAGITSVTNFQTGTGGDVISFDISGTGTLVDGDDSTVTGAGNSQIEEVVANTAETLGDGDTLIVLTSAYYATAALAEAQFEGYVTFGAAFETNDAILVAWSDGSNSYIGTWTAAGATTAPTLDGALTVVAELVGVDVSVTGTLVAANVTFVA
jgi:hypothetical protein